MKQFISNLNLSRKFALIGVLALAMVALPAWLVIKNAFEELSVAHAEAAGIAPAGEHAAARPSTAGSRRGRKRAGPGSTARDST